MNPKKVFLAFGIVFALFVVASFISLASAKGNNKNPEPEQTSTTSVRYELPKVLPAAWITGN